MPLSERQPEAQTRSSPLVAASWPCRVPGGPANIHLYLHVVDWLNEELKPSRTQQARSSEVGGILLGTIEHEAATKIIVEGLIPLPCAYESGPLFHLSGQTLQEMKQQLARWQRGAGKRIYPVGFYRSHHRKGFQFDADDNTLANEYFQDSNQVFLLIKPVADDLNAGGFFTRHEDGINGNASVLFPLNRNKLMVGETTLTINPEDELAPVAERSLPPLPRVRSQISPPVRVPEQQEVVSQPALPLIEFAQPSKKSPWIWALLMGVFIILVVSLAITLRKPAPIGKEIAADLGLKIATGGNQLRISWDNNSPLIKSATGGLLIIKDGSLEKNMALDKVALERAYFLYSNVTGDIRLSLKLAEPGKVASETMTVVISPGSHNPLSPSVAANPTPNELLRPPAAKEPLEVSPPGTGTVAKAAPPVPTHTSPPEASAKPAAKKLVLPPSQTSSMAPARPGPSEQARVVLPPPTSSIAKDANVTPPPLGTAINATLKAPQLPPPPIPTPSGAAKPAKPFETASSSAVTTIDYVAPRPIRRVAPLVPSSLRNLPISGIRIDVSVQIDAAGKVIGAESLSKGNSLTTHLSTIAVDAVRQWVFSPARRGNQNVPSEIVLQFQFGKGEF